MPTPVVVSVELEDKMSSAMARIQQNVAVTTAAYERLGAVSDEAVKVATMDAVSNEIKRYEDTVNALTGELERTKEILSSMGVKSKEDIDSIKQKLHSASAEIENMNEQTRKHEGQLQNILGVWGKIKVAIGALGIGVALKQAIDGASDLEEVQNVVDVSFGNQADRVNEWAKSTLESVGLNELSAKRYASTMGAMMASSGLAGDQIADMSMQLANLAGDMASFYNLSGDDAFNKIRSGISGETEPLKQLGINMSVANMEAYALSQGIKTAYSKMSQGEQTMLRLKYLMQSTEQAQGDFARTFGSYANQTKVLGETMKQTWQDVGAILLPVVTLVVRGINLIMNNVRKMVGFVKDHIAYIAPVFISLSVVALAYGSSIAFAAAKTWILTAATKAWSLAMQMTPIGWLVTGLALIVGGLISFATYLAKTSEVADNAFSVICGWIAVAGAAILNLGILIGNVIAKQASIAIAVFANMGRAFWDLILTIGGGLNVGVTAFGNFLLFSLNGAYQLYSVLKSVASNIGIAFKNSFSSVEGFFYSVLSTGLSVVEKMCVALNKLPFVEFDFSGIASGADEYARKAKDASNTNGKYESISDAWVNNKDHYGEAFADGWVKNAYEAIDNYNPEFTSMEHASERANDFFGKAFEDGWNDSAWLKGTEWGNGMGKKILEKLGMSSDDANSNAQDANKSAKATAANTGALAKNVDIAKENLIYMRDLAEKEAVNKFTTAKIQVDMTNNNNISKDVDSDSIISKLVSGVQEAMTVTAKGVYS